MLLTQDRDVIDSGSLGAGNSFTIAASAKAFEVLSSNLYQNKILAVIREITCNAADAHTIAGLPLSEIEVHIPSWAEPTFRVRDLGPGLSNEDVLSLYTTYFRSTKDASNDLIGGFGLGSKSPFSVADQFTVTSWHGGAKTTYVCYKQDGLPRVNVISTEPCGTETGLAVSVTAKNGDIPYWEREARNFFCWWPQLPTFTGSTAASLSTMKQALAPDNVQVRSTSETNGMPDWAVTYSGGARVMMGLVTYTLQASAIKGLPQEVVSLFSNGIFLNMPVGSLSISPSREMLSYDNNTSAVLAKKAVDIAREVVDKTRQELAEKATLLEARRFVYDCRTTVVSQLMQDMARTGKLKWQGHSILRQADLDTKNDFAAPLRVVEMVKKTHWKNFQRSNHAAGTVLLTHTFADEDTYVVWAGDKITPSVPRKIIYNYTDPSNSRVYRRIVLVDGISFDELKQVLATKGWPEPIDIADLEDPPKAAKSSAAKITTQGYLVRLTKTGMGQPILETDSRIVNDIVLTGGGIVIPFSQGSMSSSPAVSFYRRALRQGILQPSHRYLGMSDSKIKNSPKLVKQMQAQGWTFVTTDYLKSEVSIPTLKHHLLMYAAGELAYRAGERCNYDKLFNVYQHLPKPLIPEIGKLLNVLQPYKTTMRDAYFNNMELEPALVASTLGEDVAASLTSELKALIKNYTKAWEAIYKARPLLQYVTWNSASEAEIFRYLSV
jgi:hypothetical protein